MQQQCWNDWEVKRETEYGGCWIRSGYKANSGQKQLTDYQSAFAMASCLVGHHWLCQKTGTARNIHIGVEGILILELLCLFIGLLSNLICMSIKFGRF